MKIRYNIIAILFAFAMLFTTACSDEEIYIESVAGISLENVEGNLINLVVDDTYKAKIKINPENAENLSQYTTFNYTSSDKAIFTVDSEGLITALKPGDAILTVSAKENPSIKLMCMVRVVRREFPVTSIEVKDLDKSIFTEGMAILLSEYINILPENATNPVLNIESSDTDIAALGTANKDSLYLLSSGKITLTIKSTDGSDINKSIEINVASKDAEIDFVSLDRSAWVITPSRTPVSDATIKGDNAMYLFDDNKSTGLSLYKPGKKDTPKNEQFGFTIELPEATSINAFRLTHRKFGYNRLSPYAIDLLGSNDGINFTVIQKGIPTFYVANSSDVEKTRILPFGNSKEYKFIKVIYSDYDATNGDTVQVMEFELGTGTYK